MIQLITLHSVSSWVFFFSLLILVKQLLRYYY